MYNKLVVLQMKKKRINFNNFTVNADAVSIVSALFSHWHQTQKLWLKVGLVFLERLAIAS